ncbi:MAG: SIS domain-containing protein [Deltaproteobacteria bacterium]|jgi:D-sedoheptulose 7-phosphate isomerase|nr:SIS domain-containing protein [Deltaproteobacteria bacterium]
MITIINQAVSDLKSALDAAKDQEEAIMAAARRFGAALRDGFTIFTCGNGGSAAEAQHFAAEFVGRFLKERPGLPAFSLSADTSKITAIGNDYGYEEVFARQLRALARPGDCLWALSTSGTSPNILKVLEAAREKGVYSVFMCGKTLKDPSVADLAIYSPASSTPRVQELHLLYGHLVCHLVDEMLFS